jgi:glutamate-1-semialdehyde 2,1-aminomutase
MEQMAPVGPVYQAGTLSGNPLAMTAGIETLRRLQEPGVYQQLEAYSTHLMAEIGVAARHAGVSVQQNRVGSMQCTFFTSEPVVDYRTAKCADTTRYAAFFWGMLARHVYLPPSQFETTFISLAHGEKEINATIAAACEALKSIG